MSSRVVHTAWDWLCGALSDCDGDALLTSPYLTFDSCAKIADAARSSASSWTLVTSLDPSAVANGYLSVKGLQIMLDAGVAVRHVERLHAKCFLVGEVGMLGSANLTGAGLGTSASPNRELGIELEPEGANEAREIITSWPARAVDHDALDELLAASETLTRTTRGQSEELSSDLALHLAEELLADARDPERSLWMKLEYGEPEVDRWLDEAWFASPKKGKPSFRPGDFVIICAQETHDCYAVVEVTSEPEYQPQDYVDWTAAEDPDALERWPWVSRTRPRLVPSSLMELKRDELGVSGQMLRNGHRRLEFDQFTAAVRALARLVTK